MNTIVDHPNYAGMPCTRDVTGKIDWTIPSNRSVGSKNWEGNRLRREWWQDKASEFGIPIEGHWLSKVAKANHPFGRKPCQTCGRVMSLKYEYPGQRTVASLNLGLGDNDALDFGALLSIGEVIDYLVEQLGSSGAVVLLSQVFPGVDGTADIERARQFVYDEYVRKESRRLSPGAMSNAPDRLDGFHTYNLCCRSRQDTGRARSNLATYSVDRRAFEQWSEGDWAVANLVMAKAGNGRCANCGVDGPITADHIGPISLGFAHSGFFTPLCGACNSAKNNRMSLSDVEALRSLEATGAVVTSWQISDLWTILRDEIRSDEDALLLSKLLRIQQHLYLARLFDVVAAGLPDLVLQFLDLSLAEERVSELTNFDPATLQFDGVVRESRQYGYAKSQVSRTVRIAFESLLQYGRREHRNVQVVADARVRECMTRFQSTLATLATRRSLARPPLLHAIELDARAEVRDESFEVALREAIDPEDAAELRQSLSELMSEYAAVLAERYSRGEAVGWSDFEAFQ